MSEEFEYTITEVPTFQATIYVGRKQGYSGRTFSTSAVNALVQDYVDKQGLGVTITPTNFYYTGGNEEGVAIGLINYPRFPSSNDDIKKIAMELGSQLMDACDQFRISIVMSDKTIMLEAVE